MQGSRLSALPTFLHLNIQKSLLKDRLPAILILQMRKLRPWSVNELNSPKLLNAKW